jgi:short-subunit dehydrogenase
MDIAGKVALVTGASSGIGAATAERLAAVGAKVLVHGREEVRTAQVCRRTGGQVLLGDLAEPGAVDALAADALAVHGVVDLVVAAAGVGWSGPVASMPAEALDRMVAVNLLAPMRLTQLLVPGMVGRGSGHVVLISSVAGRTGVAGEAVYAATKAGLDAFAESLRLELSGSGVGVSVVVPAAVRSSFFVGRGRPYERRFPRLVEADTVADVTVEAVRRGRAEVWVPRWVRAASVVRALAPGTFRRLSTRFGEPVRSTPEGGVGR